MPRGTKDGSKRERQYEHIKDSYQERGVLQQTVHHLTQPRRSTKRVVSIQHRCLPGAWFHLVLEVYRDERKSSVKRQLDGHKKFVSIVYAKFAYGRDGPGRHVLPPKAVDVRRR
ncbi:MAG TPA: hypothetical protein VFH48_41995 [Chloroflexota bacterium]|nr:hypothetical protein [Chloroflexota bacterium]